MKTNRLPILILTISLIVLIILFEDTDGEQFFAVDETKLDIMGNPKRSWVIYRESFKEQDDGSIKFSEPKKFEIWDYVVVTGDGVDNIITITQGIRLKSVKITFVNGRTITWTGKWFGDDSAAKAYTITGHD